MLRVGLTGGIACGKSRVLRRLEMRGCRTLDLDRVAHAIMAAGGAVHAAVAAAFGSGVLAKDGEIDRKALGALVFRDAAARTRLNAIVHPEVRREERRRVAALAGADAAAVVVVDAALLVEAGMHLRFDRLVVVHCSPEQQLLRLMARDALSREDAQARISSQMPVAEKRGFGNVELDSSASPEETDARADELAAELAALARQAPERRAGDGATLAMLLRAHAGSADDLRAASRLLDDVVEAEGLEMFRVAALAGRPGAAAWPASQADSSRVAAEALMPPVAALCLARRGKDDAWLGLAAVSVARAVTAEPQLVERARAAAFRAARELWLPERERASPPPAELVPALGRFVAAARGWVSTGHQ